jgi:hypothetical protein
MWIRRTASELFQVDKRLFFVVLCLLTFFVLFLKKNFVEAETYAFQILQERGEFGVFKLLNSLQYFSIPLIYFLKFTCIAFTLWVGSFMFGYRIHYNRVWQIVMFAELIFLGAEGLKIFWFMFFNTEANIWDIKNFYPLSMMSFFDYETIHPKYIYPLKSLNLFEIAYWFILVFGIHWTAQKKLSVAYAIVLCSYVLFFLLWLLFFIGVYK